MTAFFEQVASFFSSTWALIASMSFIDVVDIILLSVILYYAYKFIHDRRAGKLAGGIVVFIIVLVLSEVLEMHAIKFLLQNVVQVGIIALIILFQPELRSALEEVGREPLKSLKVIGEQRDVAQINANIQEICSAVFDMSEDKTGALIVIERNTKLGDVIKSGTTINAQISSFLIKNIFFNKAPLHDGALIIRDGRMYAAGCFLPLSTNDSIIQDLGTRHRAAIGMSENSDAVVVCVSEENGIVSIALDGSLKRGYTPNMLRSELEELLIDETYVQKIRGKKILRKKESADGSSDKNNK